MLESLVIIDGRDHLLGRLASIVAKELLSGQKIVLVRCDEVVMSGSCKVSLFLPLEDSTLSFQGVSFHPFL
jgi:ribosomal protein L13